MVKDRDAVQALLDDATAQVRTNVRVRTSASGPSIRETECKREREKNHRIPPQFEKRKDKRIPLSAPTTTLLQAPAW